MFENNRQLVMSSELTGTVANASFMSYFTREAFTITHSNSGVQKKPVKFIQLFLSPSFPANLSHFQREPNAHYSRACPDLPIKEGMYFFSHCSGQ